MVFFETIPQDKKCILDLVVFEDVLISYNKNYNLYVNFTLDSQLKGSTLDWIGIFKAGWDKYESFLAFEWGIGEPIGENRRKRRIIIDSQYLKSALPNTNYQFVYISKHLEIFGVSQFFQFVGEDIQNDSFCLNASFFIPNDVHNSTEYPKNCDDYLELVKKSISPVKRARPTCSIKPNNWEQMYTSCWRCKSLFEMKNNHNALIEKFKICSEQNEELKQRLNKLELALENVWIPKTLLDPWDNNKERLKFQNFVSVMMTESAKPEGYEEGDHGCDEVSLMQSTQIPSLSYEYFKNSATSQELFLKAIIGSQEDKIRELTRTVNQMQRLLLRRMPMSITNIDSKATGTVSLIKANKPMTPELIHLKSCKDDKEELDNLDILPKDISEEQQLAGGDKKSDVTVPEAVASTD